MAMNQFLQVFFFAAAILTVYAGPVDLSATTNRQLGVSGHVHMDRVVDAASGQADDVCVIDDVLYRPGDRVPSSADSCEWCVCRPPGFACEPIACQKPVIGCREVHTPGKCCPSYTCDCEVRGRIYQHGQQVEASSQAPCHACYCHLGEVRCTAVRCHQRSDCTPREIPGRCCPSYEHCPPKATAIPPSQQTFRPPPEFQLPQRQRPGSNQTSPLPSTTSIDIIESLLDTTNDINNITTIKLQEEFITTPLSILQNSDDNSETSTVLEILTSENFDLEQKNNFILTSTQATVENNKAEIISEKNIESTSESEKTALEEKLSSILINLESTTLIDDKKEEPEENYKLSTFLSIETTTKNEPINEDIYSTTTDPLFKIASTSFPFTLTTLDGLTNTPSISQESITDTILVNPEKNYNIDDESLLQKDLIQENLEDESISNSSDILSKLILDANKINSPVLETTTSEISSNSFETTTSKESISENISREENYSKNDEKTDNIKTTTISDSIKAHDKQEDLDLDENISTTVVDQTESSTLKLNDQTEISITEVPNEEGNDNITTRINLKIPTETINPELTTDMNLDITITTENEILTTTDDNIETMTNIPYTKTFDINDEDITSPTSKIEDEFLVQEINELQTTERNIETTTSNDLEATTIIIALKENEQSKEGINSDKVDIFSESNSSIESDESSDLIIKKVLTEELAKTTILPSEGKLHELNSEFDSNINSTNININITSEINKNELNETSNDYNKLNGNIDQEVQKILPDVLEWKKNISNNENKENKTTTLNIFDKKNNESKMPDSWLKDNSNINNSTDLPILSNYTKETDDETSKAIEKLLLEVQAMKNKHLPKTDNKISKSNNSEDENRNITNPIEDNSNDNIKTNITSIKEDETKHLLLINKNDSELSEVVLKILPRVKEWKENLTKHEQNAESTPENSQLNKEELDEVAKKILPEVLEWKTNIAKNEETDASSIAIPEGWLEDAGIQGGITSFRGDPQEPLKILQDVIKQSQQGGFSSSSSSGSAKRADLINGQDLVILQEFFKKLYLHENTDN